MPAPTSAGDALVVEPSGDGASANALGHLLADLVQDGLLARMVDQPGRPSLAVPALNRWAVGIRHFSVGAFIDPPHAPAIGLVVAHGDRRMLGDRFPLHFVKGR